MGNASKRNLKRPGAHLAGHARAPSLAVHGGSEVRASGIGSNTRAVPSAHRCGYQPFGFGIEMLPPRSSLSSKIKLVLHLGRDPENSNSELFLLNGFTGANHDFPTVVHSIE